MGNYYVYIITNPDKTVLYTGVTNNLKRRLSEHYESRGERNHFAGKYYCHKLLSFERFDVIDDAIAREKQIKRWSRKKKEFLIETINPKWIFFNSEIFDQ